jgi:hypothetical protein
MNLKNVTMTIENEYFSGVLEIDYADLEISRNHGIANNAGEMLTKMTCQATIDSFEVVQTNALTGEGVADGQ